MDKKHAPTLQAVLAEPVHAHVNWADVEAMLGVHGAEISAGEGSLVRLALNGERAVFLRIHRKRPTKDPLQNAVAANGKAHHAR